MGQLTLLRRAPSFRLLFLSAFCSGLGTLLAVVALTIDIKDRTQSGWWVAALMIVDFLPAIAIGLLLGPFVDRFSRRRLLIGSDLVRALAFVGLAVVASSAGSIIAFAAVAGFATGFFRPAVYAGLPNLVDDNDLLDANSLMQSIENITWAIGPVLGGVLVAAAGPRLAYWLNAATFLVSAALISGIPSRLLQSVTAVSKGHWRDLREGLGIVRRSRALMTVTVAWSVVLLAMAVLNVAEVFLAKDSFNAGDFGYGLLYGAIGLGLVFGNLGAVWVVGRLRMAQVYGGSIALMALGFGAAAASPNVWAAAACCVLAGVGNGGAGVCNALLVQRGAPDELRGRAFTVVMSINYVAMAVGMVAAGPVTQALGPRWTWGGVAVVFGVGALLAWILATGISERRERLGSPGPRRDLERVAQSTEA